MSSLLTAKDLFPLQVLRFAVEHDTVGELIWNTDTRNGTDELVPFINCSDCFYWGCADAEEITPENFELYKRTVQECEALDEGHHVPGNRHYAIQFSDELFAARVRHLRPQGASYELYPTYLWPLFDDCGPVRKTGLGNPKKQPKAEDVDTTKWTHAQRTPKGAELLEVLKAAEAVIAASGSLDPLPWAALRKAVFTARGL